MLSTTTFKCFLFSALLFSLSARAEPLSVKTLQRKQGEISWRFPVVKSATPAIAARINYVLFTSVFDPDTAGIAPVNAEDSLKNLDIKNYQSLPALDFRILRNDNQIFSVVFEGEGCGAYCESFDIPLAFDLQSGRRLTGADLFSESGLKALSNEVKKINTSAIQKQLALLRKNPAENEDTATAIEMYQDCLQFWQKGFDSHSSMQFQAKALLLTDGRCSPHVIRALDDLGDFTNSFSYLQLKPWLSPYGRQMLLGEDLKARPQWPAGQVFTGTMGNKIPVSLYLEVNSAQSINNELPVSGYYFYERYRKPIRLSGLWQQGKIRLDEFSKTDQIQAQILLNSSETGLQGQWKSRDGKKQLDLRFAP